MDLGWEGRLGLRDAPRSHIDIIKKCVDRFEVRPVNVGALLEMLPAGSSSTPVIPKIPARKFCFMCGAELTPNIIFRRSCGHRLTAYRKRSSRHSVPAQHPIIFDLFKKRYNACILVLVGTCEDDLLKDTE